MYHPWNNDLSFWNSGTHTNSITLNRMVDGNRCCAVRDRIWCILETGIWPGRNMLDTRTSDAVSDPDPFLFWKSFLSKRASWSVVGRELEHGYAVISLSRSSFYFGAEFYITFVFPWITFAVSLNLIWSLFAVITFIFLPRFTVENEKSVLGTKPSRIPPLSVIWHKYGCGLPVLTPLRKLMAH